MPAHQQACIANGFPGLVSIETMNEDQALFASWGAYQGKIISVD